MPNPIPVTTYPGIEIGKNNIGRHLQPGKRRTPDDDGHDGDSDGVRGGEASSMKQSLIKS
ncbi:hypothetical protein EV421DRAFT_1910290 [Armillaria borealis]|uniref:Uncharacterized protein n=1 Tax=Armillaria borealis TaxID=47425 RepID=A0AA39IZ25_9AGAR|nr:hypothetical protein EV421DRAFT_1910290 [Armillaria borealis]